MRIGEKIVNEIIKQGMFTVSHPDPDEPHVFVWSSGAAEQLEALVKTELSTACAELRQQLAEAQRDKADKIAEARRDSERLNWLDSVESSQWWHNNGCAVFDIPGTPGELRQAIDEAMREASPPANG